MWRMHNFCFGEPPVENDFVHPELCLTLVSELNFILKHNLWCKSDVTFWSHKRDITVCGACSSSIHYYSIHHSLISFIIHSLSFVFAFCFLSIVFLFFDSLYSSPFPSLPALQVQTRSKKRWTTFSPSLRVRTSQLTRRSTRTPPALQTPTTFSLSLTPLAMSSSPTTCASVDYTNYTNSHWLIVTGYDLS